MAPRRTPTELYEEYEQKRGDQEGLFAAIAEAFSIQRVLYPGSYIDVSPSFVFPAVTYVDIDRPTKRFFADSVGVHALVSRRKRYADPSDVVFHPISYEEDLNEPEASFDLLVSLYAGFVSAACTRYLRPGGWLLANDSHGDASLASLDSAYDFVAAVQQTSGRYCLVTTSLDDYFVPKRPVAVTPELLMTTRRGIAYTKPAAAYVFQRRS